MGHRLISSVVLIATGVAVFGVGRANAATPDPSAFGVLDRLDVPSPPAPDGRAVGLPLSADPIAVPTPTAAESGGVVMAGLIGWRLTRRVAGWR